MTTIQDPYDAPPTWTYDGVERPPRSEDLIRRTARGRPYILLVDKDDRVTGEEKTYTRVTTFIDCVEDKTAIARWGERELTRALLGPRGPRFRAEAASKLGDDQKRALDTVIWKAKEAAGAEDKAAIGTAVHALTERLDLGMPIGVLEDVYQHDLDAYRAVTEGMEHLLVERFVVNDDLQTAGTPDRVTRYSDFVCELCGRSEFIFDLKTGRVDAYTHNSHAMQLALYSRSRLYDPETGERSDLPPICPHLGIVCSLPAGSGRAQLLFMDLVAGWNLVKFAAQIRRARRIKAGMNVFRTSDGIPSRVVADDYDENAEDS